MCLSAGTLWRAILGNMPPLAVPAMNPVVANLGTLRAWNAV